MTPLAVSGRLFPILQVKVYKYYSSIQLSASTWYNELPNGMEPPRGARVVSWPRKPRYPVF